MLYKQTSCRKSVRAILRYQCCCELAEIRYAHSVGQKHKLSQKPKTKIKYKKNHTKSLIQDTIRYKLEP